MTEQAVFVEGVPIRLSPDDIKRWHLASFPKLADEEYAGVLDEALEAVYAMFSGCETLFDIEPPQIYYDKTRILFRFLCCWYIADQYPKLVAGIAVMGGIPLKSKRIGPVTITYADGAVGIGNKNYQDLLAGLKSNPWGSKAYMMITCAAKRAFIGGRRK